MQLFGLKCCPEWVSLFQVCVEESERVSESVCVFKSFLTILRAQLAVSAVSQYVCDLATLSASQLLTFTLSFSFSSPLFFTQRQWLSSAVLSSLSTYLSRLLHLSSFCPFILHLFLLVLLTVFLNIVSFCVAHLSNILPPSYSLPKVCVKPFDSQCSRGCCAGLNVSSPD